MLVPVNVQAFVVSPKSIKNPLTEEEIKKLDLMKKEIEKLTLTRDQYHSKLHEYSCKSKELQSIILENKNQSKIQSKQLEKLRHKLEQSNMKLEVLEESLDSINDKKELEKLSELTEAKDEIIISIKILQEKISKTEVLISEMHSIASKKNEELSQISQKIEQLKELIDEQSKEILVLKNAYTNFLNNQLNEPLLEQGDEPRATLKTDFWEHNSQEGDADDSKVGWGLPGPFGYISANHAEGSLGVGIHLFWNLPRALTNGKMVEDESGIKIEYNSIDDDVPEELIPCDEGFSHPISFREAVENRVEFTQADNEDSRSLSEILEFGYLPDIWIISRSHHNPRDKVTSSKKWVIDSRTKKVYELPDFNPNAGSAELGPEMTPIGPNEGDPYWTATYENANGRFTFHDLPTEQGPFDYTVCGWYRDETNDPAYMDESTPESVWFEHIKNNLRWSVKSEDIDNDPSPTSFHYHYSKGVSS